MSMEGPGVVISDMYIEELEVPDFHDNSVDGGMNFTM